jgi:hypothetical protein
MMGYGLGRSPLFVMFTKMFTKWEQNAVTPIYTQIPQYEGVTLFFSIPTCTIIVPLLTIERKKSKSTNKAAFYLIINLS